VSQSPLAAGADSPSKYLDSWRSLARRIQAGWSFSGNERNCCFLNTRGGPFADVSAASGFDSSDDSRAVAVTDWDQDGDLDLWISNRTGPRIRLLQNRLADESHYLAVRLTGDVAAGTNRDAIGARVELHFDADANSPPLLAQTLYAGSGLLSQSSKWLHFGLGSRVAIARLVVRWPGGVTEQFDAPEVDRRYHIVEGSGKLQAAEKRRSALRLQPSITKTPTVGSGGRIRLANTLELPEIDYRTSTGAIESLSTYDDRVVLVNLWATWCQPCIAELGEISRRASEIKAVKLDVLALCVDGLGAEDAPNDNSETLSPEELLKKIGYPFSSGVATDRLVEQFQQLHDDAMYRQRRLPLPTSFLISRGQVVAIYKGPVSVDRLLEDVTTAAVVDGSAQARDLAIPFPGRWSDAVFATNPIVVAETYLEGGYAEDAAASLLDFVKQDPGPPSRDRTPAALARNRRLADVYWYLGHVSRAERQPVVAVRYLRKSLEFYPSQRVARVALADLLASGPQPGGAASEYRLALDQDANDPAVQARFGILLMRIGQTGQAISQYRKALQLDPGWKPAANNLAWILATHPNETHRDGTQAIALAQALLDNERPDPAVLDTLAAAQAETGQFTMAVKTAQLALAHAQQAKLRPLAEQILKRLEIYKQSMPYRDTNLR